MLYDEGCMQSWHERGMGADLWSIFLCLENTNQGVPLRNARMLLLPIFVTLFFQQVGYYVDISLKIWKGV